MNRSRFFLPGAVFHSGDFLFTGNHAYKLLHLLLFPHRKLARLAQRLHQFALLRSGFSGGEYNAPFHYFHINSRAAGKTGGFQPLPFHDDGGNTAVIRIAARISYGQLTVICRGDFWFKRLCNRMRVSHDCYSLEIVIVMSGAGVLQHIRIALKTCTYHQ